MLTEPNWPEVTVLDPGFRRDDSASSKKLKATSGSVLPSGMSASQTAGFSVRAAMA
jgi:hypothetical protein